MAHELRTPLAEIRMIADVGVMSSSLEATRSSLREVGTVTSELQQIMDSLLALARYESGQEKSQPEPVDIAALVRQQSDRLEPLARGRSVRIDTDVPMERWVMADATLLPRLLANLLGNAVAHAPEGAPIRVQMRAGGPLTITNPAPGLTEHEVRQLAVPFYRGGSGSGHGHAGLGIPLAHAIAAVCQLRLTYRLDADQRLSVVIDGFTALEPAASPTLPTEAAQTLSFG